PPRPEGLPDGIRMGAGGRLLVGEKGFMLGMMGDRIFPASCAKDAAEIAKTIPRSDGHHKEWIAACKEGRPAGSNFDWAGPLTESVLLGNVALRLGLREELTITKLLWDSEALKFTNLEDANKYLRREYREGWSV